MTKTELVDGIATAAKQPKRVVTEVLNALESTVIKGLKKKVKKGNPKVSISGFLTIEARQTSERQGRNPKTGDPLTIPARTRVAIKAGSNLKKAVAPKE